MKALRLREAMAAFHYLIDRGAGHVNQNRLRRVLILMTAALLCLVMARVSYGGERAGTGRLTLWFSLTDCPQNVMESLLSSCFRDTGLRVEATGYPDEDALGAAFESGRPDLLYCAQSRAVLLGGGVATDSDAPGTDFHAIGSRVPLLAVNTTLTDADFESIEALLEAADTDTPFLAGGCWADLLYAALSSEGETMLGDPEQDAKNAAWAELYNRLALASFRGGLAVCENAAEYVRQGLVPCAVVYSSSAAGMKGEGFALRPLPLPEGGETRYPAERMGFAVLDRADAQATELFLRWLDGRGAETAGAAGLVPDGGAQADTAPGRTLAELSSRGALYWPDTAEPFYRNRASCERALREALDLLA